MTQKKCMSIAKSLTNTQHMELEPLCSVRRIFEAKYHCITENLIYYLVAAQTRQGKHE